LSPQGPLPRFLPILLHCKDKQLMQIYLAATLDGRLARKLEHHRPDHASLGARIKHTSLVPIGWTQSGRPEAVREVAVVRR
jgi:hypothetical protein